MIFASSVFDPFIFSRVRDNFIVGWLEATFANLASPLLDQYLWMGTVRLVGSASSAGPGLYLVLPIYLLFACRIFASFAFSVSSYLAYLWYFAQYNPNFA